LTITNRPKNCFTFITQQLSQRNTIDDYSSICSPLTSKGRAGDRSIYVSIRQVALLA